MRGFAATLALVALATTACLGSSAAGKQTTPFGPVTPSSPTRLVVEVSYGPNQLNALARSHRYTLTCDPSGGTMPDAGRACAALVDLQHRRLGGCIGVLGSTGPRAVIVGTFEHRHYQLALTAAYSWCGQTRPVLRDYWVLSTFPCSVKVLREAQKDVDMNYPAWPRWAGCVAGRA